MDKLFTIFADSSCNGVNTNLIGCGDDGGIGSIIKLVLNILFAGIIVAGTIGVIIVGSRVLTARDDQSQVEKAKKRMAEIVIGLLAVSVVWLVIPLFLPNVDESNIDKTLAQIDEDTKHVEPEKADPTQPTTPTTPSNPDKPAPAPSPKPPTPATDNNYAYSVSDAVWNNGNECSSAKVWPAKKYALTQEEIKYFSELVARENCRSSKQDDTVIFGCRLLATQIINLYEERQYDRGGREGCSGGACYYKDMKKWVTSDKWYHANKNHDLHPGQYSNKNSTQAVIDVIVNGYRALPKFVNRYDGLYHWTSPSYSDSSYLGMNSISEAAKAVPMKTKVKSGERYLWCLERKQTSNKYNGPYNEVFNYDDRYRRAVGM